MPLGLLLLHAVLLLVTADDTGGVTDSDALDLKSLYAEEGFDLPFGERGVRPRWPKGLQFTIELARRPSLSTGA